MPKKLQAEKSLEVIKTRWVSNDIAMRALKAPISPDPVLSHRQQQALEDALLEAGIMKLKASLRKSLEQALGDAIAYSKKPHLSYNQKKLTRQSFGTSRPMGSADRSQVSLLLCAALFRVWRDFFKEEPTISRPLTPKHPKATRSAFVRFARSVLLIARLRKAEDRLLAYRAYERDLGLYEDLRVKKKSPQRRS